MLSSVKKVVLTSGASWALKPTGIWYGQKVQRSWIAPPRHPRVSSSKFRASFLIRVRYKFSTGFCKRGSVFGRRDESVPA